MNISPYFYCKEMAFCCQELRWLSGPDQVEDLVLQGQGKASPFP